MDTLRKLLLSVAVLLIFGWLIASGPDFSSRLGPAASDSVGHGDTRSHLPGVSRAIETPSTRMGSMILNGHRGFMEEVALTSCEGEALVLSALCEVEPCLPLLEHVDGTTSSLSWIEGFGTQGLAEGQSLHLAVLDCVPGRGGRRAHFSAPIGSSPGLSEAVAAESETGMAVEKIPRLPGAERIAELESSGWTIAIEKPRFADVALEQLSLMLSEQGWRQSADVAEEGQATEVSRTLPYGESRAGRAPVVLQRGSAICLLALGDDPQEGTILIHACHFGEEGSPP